MRLFITTILLSISLLSYATDSTSMMRGIRRIPEIELFGKRPLKEIGTTQTKMDSMTLKENIALSIADVLTFNSPIFVKSYGRATLSTVSFRGTSASHTQVTWNDMKINNPMLGMTDFSTIPSYFIDDASLLHGTSSVNETGGGLGGAVKLSTKPANADGFGLQYIQGVGSFYSFDEFLRLTYGDKNWQTSTRVVLSTSPNNFKYRNHDKKENVYDENMNIIDQYYPIERNKSGSYRDLHLLQEAYYNNSRGDRLGLNAWYVYSNRELPMLTTDYGEATDFENRQREHTFRGIFTYDHLAEQWKFGAKAGYIYTWMAYDYKRDLGNGIMAHMTRSRSRINTIYGQVNGEYYIGTKWLFTANLSAHQHFVRSEDKNIILQSGDKGIVGYHVGRLELSGALSAKWQPTDRIGLSAVVREEMFGDKWSPIIPALFFEGVLSRPGNLTFKLSGSRNYRFPTLNDLYFLPGGNPDLRHERGWTYDAGLNFAVGKKDIYTLTGSLTWFDSYIDDWIIWLPTTKGFFSPRNLKKVHAYGLELQTDLNLQFSKDWALSLNSTFSWSPSINVGEPLTAADQSVGKQLPYVPEISANIVGRLSWRTWAFTYKWCHYSERYTMSSNDITLTGRLPKYYMSNVSLEKSIHCSWADWSLKGVVNNLFNEEYLSVLARPMPRINFQFFVGITPIWKK
ncbi:MAG: TonB-dependent receptor plug domain-containing protein [Paludibacteraceae bacterium]|nr:TonB-dependent receptor plug domain-containing protein [Paludibacteraceae bacterium]